MIATGGVRRLCASHWVRLGVVTVVVALVVTALLATLGHASLATPAQALVYSLTMALLTKWTLPRVVRRTSMPGGPLRWLAIIGVLLTVALVGTFFACGLLTLLGLDDRRFWVSFASAVRVSAVLTVTVGIGMMLYEMQRNRLDTIALELKTKELEHERARKMALEARLASLESRLHPHFLFNTLNSISALIQEDPDLAERTVERLAALLRFALDASERGTVTLGDELKIVTDYLEIEATRLGKRLSYTLDVVAEVTACEVPPLAVQTLVENSIKHAIAPRPAGGSVRVQTRAAGDDVVVGVWDDGPGFTISAIRPGHGLDNLQGRLAARFGPAATLIVAPHDGGTLVTVTLPRTRSREP